MFHLLLHSYRQMICQIYICMHVLHYQKLTKIVYLGHKTLQGGCLKDLQCLQAYLGLCKSSVDAQLHRDLDK